MRAQPTFLASLAFAFAFVGACGSATPPPPVLGNTGETPGQSAPHEVLATLERGACFGFCPMYKLTIYKDGAVEYEGERFVKVTGPATGTTTPEALAKLDEAIVETRYMALDDAYKDQDMTDMPWATSSYSRDGATKRIEHYFGDSDAPKELVIVEDAIDEAAQSVRWVGTQGERDALRNQQP
jgi:hypothetical protein